MSTSRTAVIGSPVGLHARPAAIFVKAVTASGHAVSLHKADQSANAASILSVQLSEDTQSARLRPRSAERHERRINRRVSPAPPIDADQHPAHAGRR